MGDCYRDELKSHKKGRIRPSTLKGRTAEARLDRADQARNSRREAIKRQQSLKALHWGKEKASAQGRLM